MTLEPKAAKLWTPTEKWALVVLVAGLVSSLFVFVHPWYDRTPDSSVYVALGKSLAAGEGYVFLETPFRLRPPGFPALVGRVVRACGTSFLALNALVSVLGAAAVVLLFLHQRDRVGWVLALLTAVAVWLNPGYQRLCNQVMSDVPGLALLLLCLLVERRASRAPALRHEALLGLGIGLAAYIRSASILLLPAIALARILARLRQEGARESWGSFALLRLGPYALVAAIVVLPWSVSQRLAAPPPPADQTLNYSLSTAMWHTDPGDPASPRIGAGALLARVPPHLREMAWVLGSRMQLRIPGSPPPSPRQAGIHAAVAALLLASFFWVLIRRRAPAELFVSLTLLVVAVYFVFTDRLVLPAYVLAFAAAVEALRDLLRRLLGARVATLVLSLAILSLVAWDFKPRHDWPAIEEQHRAFVELAAAVTERLAPDARLAAGQGLHYGVYLDRPVYSLMHAVRRLGLPDGAEEIIDKYRINTVLLSQLVPQDEALAPYFEERYGPGERAGSARVWRVRP